MDITIVSNYDESMVYTRIGIFGMNLTNHMEADPVAFFVVCGGIATVILLILITFRNIHADKLNLYFATDNENCV